MAKVQLTQECNNKLTTVYIGNTMFCFSYSTIVAYSTPKDGLVCSVNNWSNTTARHLNQITPKENRIPYKEFEAKLENLMKELNL